MLDGIHAPQNLPPIAAEDLVKLGVESRLIPFIVSTTLRAEQSSNGSLPLSPTEAENIAEILDKVVSSATVNPSLKNRYFRVLREVSHSHGVLPESYFPNGVTLTDTIPYTSGGFIRIWRGRLDGNQVSVKVLRARAMANLDKTKRRFYSEIVGWKYISHPNVLPILGVSETLFPFCIITPWSQNGNIIEYTRENQGVNRLQLLAQAACGLEYLHSLSVIHGVINLGNTLVSEDGIARLGDFGIVGVIADPSVVEPYSMLPSKEGVFHYVAPELLYPSQFGLSDSNPSKMSDIYSLAMIAYETLTETPPYGNAQDSLIMLRFMAGDRPPRPPPTRWLQDPIWNMITTCWGENREQRWDIRAVYNQFLVSSIQEIVAGEQDVRIMARNLNTVADALSVDLPPVPFVQETSAGADSQPTQVLVNAIDEILEQGEVPFGVQPELFNILGKMCSRFKTIPDSMRIESSLDGPMDEVYDGGYATVFRGEYLGYPVAIKTLHLYLIDDFEERFGKFRREVVAWRHLRHPHILPLIGVNLERHKFAMVSEWMDHGSINEFIENNQGVNRVQLLVDAANGLEYMHSVNMVHGDLKGSNILINQSSRACLADFGLSTIVGIERRAAANASLTSVASNPSLVSFTAGGTTRWMSPELLDPDQFGITDCRPTKQSDCYAFGMVVYEVLSGNVPFWDIKNPGAVISAIMRGDRPQKPEGAEGLGFTTGLWKTIERCWLADANERPDVKDVLFQLNHATWSWNRKRLIRL